MDIKTNQIFFALLRCAVCGGKLTEAQRDECTREMIPSLLEISAKHDVVHLIAFALKDNGLAQNAAIDKCVFTAVYRYERLKHEYDELCDALEKAEVAFVPLKGSVLRDYYPEPWMRTSCDIDVLVRPEDVERAVSYLSENLQYTAKGRATHDISLYTPTGVHIEIHFDLVEEKRANNAIDILRTAWDNVSPKQNSTYHYEMSDEFFYFYHIAHMAKHFETGGCGIRPFIDLWILDGIGDNKTKRDELLAKGNLLKFTDVCRALSRVWFDGAEHDDVSLQMQEFLMHGGVYGSPDNRVALQQKKKGGWLGYIISRMFIPYSKLKRYYPIVEKHRWLVPVMQVKRWFMLMRKDVAKMAKKEIAMNSSIDKNKAEEMNRFLDDIGLK